MKNVDISVVMPVYSGDSTEQVKLAIESIENQTCLPKKFIIVQDGPVPLELVQLLKDTSDRNPIVEWLVLKENKGLAEALNAGIIKSDTEWIARMDADDFSMPDRLEIQWNYIEKNPEISLLSSWIDEYDDALINKSGIRKLPEKHEEIVTYSKWRCPINHMAAVYKRSAVIDCGLYKSYGAVGDDYVLWGIFIKKGYKLGNVQQSCVKARTGDAFFKKRRRGWNYLKNEIHELRVLKSLGIINTQAYVLHVIAKSIIRLSPAFVVKWVYSLLRN
jgi:glycosyltransferase involved in cell wall biosynthesis